MISKMALLQGPDTPTGCHATPAPGTGQGQFSGMSVYDLKEQAVYGKTLRDRIEAIDELARLAEGEQ